MLQGDVGLELGARVASALRAFEVDVTAQQALVRPSTRDGVDYQCNVAMSLGKQLGQAPRALAQAIVDNLDAGDMVSDLQIAGPGFINITLKTEWLAEQAAALLDDPRIGAPIAEPRRFAIDYSSPNVAKEMHVGHLRSSIIGDAILRTLRFAGHEVIPHNHLGDWGTPFGMLIEHLVDEGWTAEQDSSQHTISDLNSFYQAARKNFDADADFATRARKRVVLLQAGDEDTLALWRELVEESTRHFVKVYELLGIELTPEDTYGESFYNPMLAEVIGELEAKELTEVSDGALCVFPPGFTNRDGDRLPLIARKSDGGYGYAITDLATARYWTKERGAVDLLYVVGSPQAQHFKMIFEVARQAGWLHEDNHAVHIGFGAILGEDGKTIRTRAGGSIKLVELLTEAIDRAAAIVAARTELDETERAGVARAVGIGAVKYADLSSDREKDYVFAWDRMLAMEGNTAVYLQYANTRILSILRKATSRPAIGTPVMLGEAAERDLVLQLLRWPAALDAGISAYAPHKLCAYLYDTATAFSAFYEKCPILAESTPEGTRQSRLVLAQLTSNVLTLGLSLLGIEAPERL